MAEVLVENIPEGGEVFMIQGSEEDNNVKLVRKGVEEGYRRQQNRSGL